MTPTSHGHRAGEMSAAVRKSRNAEAKTATIELLLSAGWVEDGETQTQSYRQGTSASPVYGNTGGELVVTGGRHRFVKPESGMKATVGAITTCFYAAIDGKTKYFVNIPTREIERIRKWSDGVLP